jgi:hypothetical protein
MIILSIANPLFYQKYYIPDIDIAGTNQCAFPAEHAFLYFIGEVLSFTPAQGQSNLSHIKTNQVSGTACCGATATGQTRKE